MKSGCSFTPKEWRRYWDKHELIRLNEELFNAVQGSQGGAFLSDGMVYDKMTKKDFFDAVRRARKQTYISAKVITKFLKKYKESII